jgi:molybdate transport system ATP-binding protein
MTKSESVISARFSGARGKFKLDVAFEAPMHGITAIFGPSGCGKTTILRCISGLDHLPGRLSVGGDVWQDEAGRFRQPHDRPIGYVFQEPSLFPHLSVRKNLLYGHQRALSAGVSDQIPFDDVVRLMGIHPLLDRTTTSLSGGERQRVAIGRAILSQPRLLLMDEPLSSLDERNKEEILPYFEALHDTLSIPILYVSHDIAEVERLGDVLVLVDEGRVLASGPLEELLPDSRLPIARRSDAATVVDAVVKAFDSTYALTEMSIYGESLFIPGRVADVGKTRRVRIAAADVSLSADHPSQTSILNVIPAQIREIHEVNDAQANIVMSIGHREGGPALLARISRRACHTLNFVAGQKIYAQVKAVSLVESR